MWAALGIDEPAYGNAARWPEFRDHCAFHGIIPGVWVTDGWKLAMTPPDAAFTIAELESQGDYDGVLASPTPSMPHAVITNFTPLTDPSGVPLPEKAKPLIDNDWFCITEAYLGSNPNATPDALDVFAKQLGWGVTQPAFGLYNAPPSAYSQWAGWPGCDYLGENVLQ